MKNGFNNQTMKNDLFLNGKDQELAEELNTRYQTENERYVRSERG